MKNPVSIKEVLKEVVADLEGGRQQTEEAICKAWATAVGVKAVKHTRIEALRNQTLVVLVDSSPWLYLLSLYKNKILKKMKESNPGAVAEKVKQLYFKTGKV